MTTESSKKIRIFIADDHAVVRQGMKHIISQNSDMEVVGEAENGREAMQKIGKMEVDVVLMDIEMPGQSGWEAMVQLKSLHPGLKVIILSIFPEDHYGLRLIKAGAYGYLTKKSAPEQLVEAIRKVAHGGKFISPALAEQLLNDWDTNLDRPPHERLSEREFQVFCMLAHGKNTADIAKELSVSITTVSTHKANILEKMKMKNTIELVRYAFKNGLVD